MALMMGHKICFYGENRTPDKGCGGGGGVLRKIQWFFFLVLNENICCDHSLELMMVTKYDFMEKYG